VPQPAIREIAEMLDLSPAEVLDTMTFYGFFRTEEEPLGKTRLWLCRSLACMIRGSDALQEHVCKTLGVQPGGTTADKAITLETAECIGACEGAPCALVNDEAVTDLTNEKADELLAKLRRVEPRRGVFGAERARLRGLRLAAKQVGILECPSSPSYSRGSTSRTLRPWRRTAPTGDTRRLSAS
jgi:NADH-quinone oxidoreductase subunit E